MLNGTYDFNWHAFKNDADKCDAISLTSFDIKILNALSSFSSRLTQSMGNREIKFGLLLFLVPRRIFRQMSNEKNHALQTSVIMFYLGHLKLPLSVFSDTIVMLKYTKKKKKLDQLYLSILSTNADEKRSSNDCVVLVS